MKLFSDKEMRAVIIFIPLAAVVVALFSLLSPKPDTERARSVEIEMEQRKDSVEYAVRQFDPNTVTYEELVEMGISKYVAVSLLKYRATGKVFRIKEDVALCYGISDSLYATLKPYIKISRKYAIAPKEYSTERIVTQPIPPTKFLIDTVSVRYLRAIGALSRRQAEAFIRWRDLSGIYDMEELRECYVVSDSVATALEPYIIFPERTPHPIESPIEINTADSATLISVVGIGEKTAARIIEYRTRLGGFHRIEQLSEVFGINERNAEMIFKQIYCESCNISKIDINFATPKRLSRHPYITPSMLRKLLKHRQLKGGWSSTEELVEEHIMTKEEVERLAPYIVFGNISDQHTK